ncbi:MAG: tetratricopeptide repeat protein [Planctomycetota bacterium]
MRTRKIIIGACGAVLTGATALLAYDAVGFLPSAVVDVIPGPIFDAAPWAWKVLASLVVVYVVVSVVWRRRGGSEDQAPSEAEIPIELDLSEPPEYGHKGSLPQPPAPHIAHPYLLADGFTGRFPEREELTDWLRKKKSAPARALVSVGGMGKSALAWVWLHQDVLGEDLSQVGQDPPDVRTACRVPAKSRPQGVMWWSFGQPGAGFSAFLDEALAYLSGGAVKPSAYLSSRSEKLESLLELLRDNQFLLILDGFERELRAFASLGAAYQGDEHAGCPNGDERMCSDLHAAEFLRRLVAQPTTSRVLLTSRLLPAELDDSGLSDVVHRELSGLEPMDAVSFMQGMGIRGEEGDIEAACGTYRYHPLALRLLAGVLRGSAETGQIRNARRFRVPGPMKGREHHHIVDVACKALGARAQALASHLAVFRCPVTSKQASGRDGALKGALSMLVVRGLVTFDTRRDRYDLHPVVRQHAYARLPGRARVHDRLAGFYAQVRLPVQITRIEELQPGIEQYHHLVGARRYEEAFSLLSGRLATALRDRFADRQMLTQLLQGLFGGADGMKPHLANRSDQAWAVAELAKAYSYSGETRRAATLCEANLASFESKSQEESLAVVLGVLAGVQSRLGRLEAAEASLRRLVELTGRLGREPEQAIARNRLGLLLAHRAAFDEAVKELDAAFETMKQTSDRQIPGVCFSYYTQRELLMDDPEAALDAARKARAFVEESARRTEPDDHDYVRSGWLMGAALLASASTGGDDKESQLDEAERYLSDAFSRCRRGDLVGFEPDLFMAWARWHRLKGNGAEAARFARDALALAGRCEYRLKLAEIHNFLARLALDASDKTGAREHVRQARDCARCDGEPYCYKPALDESGAIAAELGEKSEPDEDLAAAQAA